MLYFMFSTHCLHKKSLNKGDWDKIFEECWRVAPRLAGMDSIDVTHQAFSEVREMFIAEVRSSCYAFPPILSLQSLLTRLSPVSPEEKRVQEFPADIDGKTFLILSSILQRLESGDPGCIASQDRLKTSQSGLRRAYPHLLAKSGLWHSHLLSSSLLAVCECN